MCISVKGTKKSAEKRKSGIQWGIDLIADFYADRQEYICRGLKKSGSQWECLLCHTFYKSRQKAFNHIEAKHLQDEAAYFCPYCPSTFKTQNSYYVHLSTSHKEEHKLAKIFGK